MRILAIGDIHGCYRALTTLAHAARITDEDRVVALGDYVDRGPDSFAVMEWLVRRFRQEQLVPLFGNHEQMMCEARQGPRELREWLVNGGDKTLASYSPLDDEGRLSDIPDDHWTFLERHCRDWFETDSHFFVHANAHSDLPFSEQPAYMLRWESFCDPKPHHSGKTMICGHTPQRSGEPLALPHAVCIDTWVYGGGWLTCLEVATGRYWQANEQGAVREGRLRQ